MGNRLALALAFAALGWTGSAHAAETATASVCRALPSARATVVERLPAGATVDVLASRGGWSKVRTPAPHTCWIASRSLGGATALPLASGAPRRSLTRVTRPRRAASVRTTRSRAPSYGGSCPCGSGRICVGPRGGRYCITSGGNKRYGV